MPHASVKLIPGVDQRRTPALNEAGISESNLIRFVPDRQGYGLVQKLGGWKSYRMVAEVYGHLERSSLDNAMRESGANLVQAVTGAENVVPIQRRKV
jgi:hypothetical protein